MDGMRRALRGLPIRLRCTVIGAVVLGLIGAAVGLVAGLRTYAPTAWAATFEVGLPAMVLGAVVGALVGSLMQAGKRAER